MSPQCHLLGGSGPRFPKEMTIQGEWVTRQADSNCRSRRGPDLRAENLPQMRPQLVLRTSLRGRQEGAVLRGFCPKGWFYPYKKTYSMATCSARGLPGRGAVAQPQQTASTSSNNHTPLLPLSTPVLLLLLLLLLLFWDGVLPCHPGWNAVAQSWLTAASASLVQVIVLPQPPE